VLRRDFAAFGFACSLLHASQEQPLIERLTSGFQFTEGPVWLPESAVLFSDIPSNRLIKWSLKDGNQVVRENSGGANGNAIDSRGRVYTCEGGARRITRTGTDNKVAVLAERFEGKRFNAPNDIAVRRDGHAWFTDPAFGKAEATRELPFNGVFHIKPKGDLSVVARMDRRPNGVALSPDGRILYVAISDERAIRAWDINRDGEASNPRLLITGIDGPPDGLKTDSKGNLYVAANQIVIYSPKAELLRQIPMPEKPSNLCFGPDDKAIYVTARTTLYRVYLDAKQAQAQP
jgi:gluconolactonase